MIAGIDVHKKVLMVVVIDATKSEGKPERRRFTTLLCDLQRLSSWFKRRMCKKRSWNPRRNIGGGCGWNWSRI